MNKLVTLVCLVALALELVSGASTAPSESHSSSWLQFKRQYGKVYASQEEDAMRFANFLRNKQLVERHNSDKSATFKMGLNHMSDWTDEEFRRMGGSIRKPTGKVASGEEVRKMLGVESGYKVVFPDNFDWRNVSGRVSRVKDQGKCAAGWAFATTGLMEGQQKVLNASRDLIELSTQQLIDCSSDNWGCKGGGIDAALDDMETWGGIQSEADYSFVGKDQKCRMEKNKFVMPVIDHLILLSQHEEFIKQIVFLAGPVAVSLDGDYFRNYKEGIINMKSCGWVGANHSVLIVGYGVDEKQGFYWIVKNSWGTSWGESGYFRISRDVNMCGIANFVVIPKI